MLDIINDEIKNCTTWSGIVVPSPPLGASLPKQLEGHQRAGISEVTLTHQTDLMQPLKHWYGHIQKSSYENWLAELRLFHAYNHNLQSLSGSGTHWCVINYKNLKL